MKNRVDDVRNHLVAMMELLGEEGVSAEEMELRIKRAQATSTVAAQYTAAVRVELDAVRTYAETRLLPNVIQVPDQPAPSVLAFDKARRTG